VSQNLRELAQGHSSAGMGREDQVPDCRTIGEAPVRSIPPQSVDDVTEELLRPAAVAERADLSEWTERWHHQDHILAALADLFTKQEAFQDRMLRAVPVFSDRCRRLRPFDIVATQEQDQIDRRANPVILGEEDAGQLFLDSEY